MLEDQVPSVSSLSLSISDQMQKTKINTRNAKINQAIMEWFESWQVWQRKILITGIINRFEYNQLRGLLMAVESVFHKDFTTTIQKIYPVPSHDLLLDVPKIAKPENIFRVTDSSSAQLIQTGSEDLMGKSEQQTIDLPLSAENKQSDDNMRIRSPLGHRNRTHSGSEVHPGELSHPLSPIAEGEITHTAHSPGDIPASMQENSVGLNDLEMSGQPVSLVSHIRDNINSPHTSSQATLVSSLSPIEETSLESPVSGENVSSIPLSPCSIEIVNKKDKSGGKKTKKRKKKKNGKEKIPEEVVERIASFSVLTKRQVPSNVSLTPIGKESNVTLDFRSGVSSAAVETDDFFDNRNNKYLGKPVTTQSKVRPEYELDYDFKRNKLPVPTAKQLYKSKKLWNKDTVPVNTRRLKEQFRTQLDQIWEWIDDWPAYRRTRLLLSLFSKSSDKLIQFTAECLKAKTAEADDIPPPISMLSDALLLKIFGRLDSTDLLQASLVCKHWYSLLNSDLLWKEKCDEIGLVYGIPNLADLLLETAVGNQALDWKQAFTEVEQYLNVNLEPVGLKLSESEEEESSSEEEQEEENKFKDYVPYWKAHPPSETREKKRPSIKRQEEEHEEILQNISSEPKIDPDLADQVDQIESRASRKRGGFLQMWKNITEDIKEDTNLDDARSDACYEVDMFADMQSWEDVGLMTNIGQRFAVDYKIIDAIDAISKNWRIKQHVVAVKKVQVLKGHLGSVNVVKGQGNRIFSGSSDRCIRVWDRMGRCFAKISDIKGGINDISIGSIDESKLMYTACWDYSIRVWNTQTFRTKGTLTGHKGSVSKVAADGKFIVSCSHDGTIKIWDRKKMKCENTITCHRGAVESMIYHNRQIITGGIDKMIHVNNSFTGRLVRTFVGHQAPVTALKKQHDLLLSGDMQGKIYFWSMASDSASHVDVIQAHESQINAMSMHGPTFFSASKDALIKEWDIVTMLTVRIFQGHTDAVTDVQWTDKYLLTASRDNDVRIWWWKGSEDDSSDDEKENTLI